MDSNKKSYELTNKHSSLVSVDHRPTPSKSDEIVDQEDDTIANLLQSDSSSEQITPNNDHRNSVITERIPSLTQMLLIYIQEDLDRANNSTQISTDHNLNNILNVLELHFNTYADDKHEIYFEGIFQILLDFKEHITEAMLIETMQSLQINPLHPCNFENFILLLCHLPPLKTDHHVFLDVFNELDHNKDSYITFEDIQMVLPHLTSHFDEEIIRAAIHTIDTDHDNGRLSYMDFVTSFLALQECKSTMKTKTTLNEDSRIMTE